MTYGEWLMKLDEYRPTTRNGLRRRIGTLLEISDALLSLPDRRAWSGLIASVQKRADAHAKKLIKAYGKSEEDGPVLRHASA